MDPGIFAPMHEIFKNGALQAAVHKDDDKDASVSVEIKDPWDPPYLPCPPCEDDTESHCEQSTAVHKDDDKDASVSVEIKDSSVSVEIKDPSVSVEINDPWNPPYLPCPPCEDDTESNSEKSTEWCRKNVAFVANSRATSVIVPDRTPKWVSDALWHKVPDLVSILEEDDVQRFLHLFSDNTMCMAWGFIITPQTFNYIIKENALRCAEVALEGKAPELSGNRANPNCMNPYGYFPLHGAAERFSVDMIKLLFKYGASANVRTAGKEIIENLLPLHVAVENTCLHKYLEDNLFPNQDPRDYIYRLIQLLCLPEMKIFLDTTRLLATRTDNLLDEVWNYVKDGKLIQTAVLLLACQEQIRGDSLATKRKSMCKPDGFDTIMSLMMKHSVALKWEIGENGRAQNQSEAISVLECTALLVDVISQAGTALDAYIQTHSEVSHVEILERVSSILTDYGFSPNGKGIDVTNLFPFDCKMFFNPVKHGDLDATKVATEMANPHAITEMAVRNLHPGGWNLEYIRNCFFPYWRSVLLSHVHVTVYPAYARADPKCRLNLNKQHRKSADKVFSPTILLERFPQVASYHTSRRLLGTAVLGRTPQLARYRTSRRLLGTVELGRTPQVANYHTYRRIPGTTALGRTPQITSNHTSRKLFGAVALTLLKVLKNA
ncbi:hypothetical protein ACP70R_032433 [Stipagrostis hirtigluma subsp. patula]